MVAAIVSPQGHYPVSNPTSGATMLATFLAHLRGPLSRHGPETNAMSATEQEQIHAQLERPVRLSCLIL